MSFGSGSLPMYLYLEAKPAAYFELAVTKDGQTVRYSGKSSRITHSGGEGNFMMSFTGTYSEQGSVAGSVGLPSSGTFNLDVTVDCISGALRQESLALSA
jgi:hypothetical protein